jgi:hypothetical protein
MSTAPFEILGTARPFGLPRVRWIAGIVGATIGCTCALVAGFVMQPAYRASIVLTVVRDNDRVDLASAIGSQLGSLASLTGIGSAASSDRAEAVSLLGSRYLARSFIERYKLLPALADAMRGPMSLTDEPPTLERAVKSLGSDVIAPVLMSPHQSALSLPRAGEMPGSAARTDARTRSRKRMI